ncbi:amylo-alpha-1,6-glucosidase [Planctomonas sp. JC2975]|uniref:amylo-alpha-1,6-glucosidase n=1 Tax=Planctomonas sp. JC2975 TaxID=2729626 RepID=UPI001473A1CD|nr:glycogen debranching N-terminal domain-containing protein [Planctomonas sp. JC2975]NNC12209.1 amylo-alpha-1,6-glucosidase [Planctomonas sp. JC2975]
MQQNRQPFLNDQVIVLRAPTQVWSDRGGDAGRESIHGLYHGDVRVLAGVNLTADGERPEWISVAAHGASGATFTGVLRHLDGDGADPRVRIERVREVTADSVVERIVIRSARDVPVRTRITVELRPDFAPMQDVKAGIRRGNMSTAEETASGVRWTGGATTAELRARDAELRPTESGVTAEWDVLLAPNGSTTLLWRIDLSDADAVVSGAIGDPAWSDLTISTGDSRLSRWVTTALSDLDALRMTSALAPGEEFLAAGAPWFFTLFGRDSLWAARFLLPVSTTPALSTLRVLAAAQGTKTDQETAEQPGKIMHELRATELNLEGGHSGSITLPPLYYGTIDATPLWICLLHDAWRWGEQEDEIASLLPHLEAALAWMRDHGDSDGDGFLEYADTTGHGLANQGWKDSGDSIQWRDGTLAEGPIALCEVQAYAYEAAVHGADLLDRFGRPGAAEWRAWAAALAERFREAFWVDDPEGGRYPAVALDAGKRRVDTLTSNIGHLVGTGLLNAEEEREVADRLTSPRLDSGFGLRTMATDSAGYWPLSYHGGSVWAHDTAIAIAGLGRAGLADRSDGLVDGLLRAAERFDFRMPELHSGDAAAQTTAPAPYPAACRPQAWSAAAAVAVLTTRLGLRPDGSDLVVAPVPAAGSIDVRGIRVGRHRYAVRVADGVTEVAELDPDAAASR